MASRAGGALAIALVLAACADDRSVSRTAALSDCHLPKLAVAAQCGAIDVPEDRANAGGRKIRIAFAVLTANTLDPKPDPLFVLAGGPGQAATHLGPLAMRLVAVRKDRDIVLIDQRGTGRSSPLECAAFAPEDSVSAALDLDPLPKARACVAELRAKGVDPSKYTTTAWVEDVDAVRAALGYDKLNLWGGSYGTRAALEYLRRHEPRVRSLVLDSVAPPSMRISLDVWPTRDAALSAIIDACKAAPACAAAHPDPAAALAGIRDSLGQDGRTVSLADPRTGDTREVVLTFEHVIGALQPMTYVPELAGLLPEVIERAAKGDFGPLYAVASLVTADLAEQMNAALHYSVTCAEDVPRVGAADREKLAGVRSRPLAERLLAVCDVWPRGDVPADATAPVTSSVPVLLLSGGPDPVTPPAYAATVAGTLPNSRHVVAQGYGHIVTPHACAPRLVAAFIADPSFATLPASCLRHFERSARTPLWPDRLAPQR